MSNIAASNINELKRLYAAAVLKEKEEFMFQGEVIVTDFAKYAIEYYESRTK